MTHRKFHLIQPARRERLFLDCDLAWCTVWIVSGLLGLALGMGW